MGFLREVREAMKETIVGSVFDRSELLRARVFLAVLLILQVVLFLALGACVGLFLESVAR